MFSNACCRLWCSARLVAMFSIACVAVAARAATPTELQKATTLISEQHYQEALALLQPLAATSAADGQFNYLLGRAALGSKQPELALMSLKKSLELNPDDIEARLALGRAYYQLGRYAEANLMFETVLRFDNLPPDVHTQAEIYARSAERFQDQKSPLLAFGYAATGVGQYKVNPTSGTNALGGNDRRDTFYNARIGGGLNYELPDNYALDASLDYRFRYYDNPASRNDEDLRWRAAASRAMGDGNLTLGARGRNSYRGQGTYRNDFGLFTNYRYQLDADNQVSVGGEVRRRRYPNGPMSNRSFSTATGNVGWTHSIAQGQASFGLNAHAGSNFNTVRADGDSTVYGMTTNFDVTFTERLSGFVFGWWEHDAFNTERAHFSPDETNPLVSLQRQDNLYEMGAGLVWGMGQGWSLRPEMLYIRDQSNATAFNYSSTEVWINLRKDF